ncbi:ATP-grasp domain-containing protein [Fibrella aquatica]|uniref:ATP-grasp domain-containing protein n=1 Tax=Fibrella aquatica TaxID=3242487 RepID=UPI00351FB3A0
MLGLPIAVKQLTGSQGSGVSILDSLLSVKTILESFYKANVPVKMQRFIKSASGPTGSVNDIRAIVVGNEVVSVMEQGASGGDFRANLSQGGKAAKIRLSEDEKKVCINAAKALGLEFAGVDLMREAGKKHGETNSCYVTEVNGNPGTGIIDITGHNHFTDLVKFIADRKATKVKNANAASTADTQANALSSYPADMIHANMTPQQVSDSYISLLLNDAKPNKIEAQEAIAGEILDKARPSEQPVIDSLQSCELQTYALERFGKSQSTKIEVIQPSFLSEASAQALDIFKRIGR